jgi:hypothetical protein
MLVLVLALPARAVDLPPPLTLDLPVAANLALPTWLGKPEIPATTFATLDLPILTPDTTASLLVTVYFQEKQGGFMRITWQGTQGAQVLADNFYENIGMANQRSLLISPSTLIGDGTLIFQCGDATLGIQRVKLEWLQNKDGLVSPQIQEVVVTTASGQTQLGRSLSGQATPTEPGAWQDQVVTVPMTDSAQRIEEGVDFSIDLDQVPTSARVALQESGLALGQHLIVWINGERAGTITPAVPDLLDGGFLADEASATATYIGWRDASFYVPVKLLKEGVNTVQFSGEDDLAPASGTTGATDSGLSSPVAIKAFVLQLNYAPPSGQPAFLLPQLSLTPTGPITPADPTPTPSPTDNP